MKQIHVQGVWVLMGKTLVEHCNETNTCTGCRHSCKKPLWNTAMKQIHVWALMGETLLECCNEINTCTGCVGARVRNPSGMLQRDKDMYRV